MITDPPSGLAMAIAALAKDPGPEMTPETHPLSYQFIGECLDRRDAEHEGVPVTGGLTLAA